MKRNDPNFKEQFIILHDENGEVIVKKSEIKVICVDEAIACHSNIDIGSDAVYEVYESIDEILELL